MCLAARREEGSARLQQQRLRLLQGSPGQQRLADIQLRTRHRGMLKPQRNRELHELLVPRLHVGQQTSTHPCACRAKRSLGNKRMLLRGQVVGQRPALSTFHVIGGRSHKVLPNLAYAPSCLDALKVTHALLRMRPCAATHRACV